MNWDQITAISSVLGVAGGSISVYFVVLEIRRTAEATEGATVQSLMNFENDVFGLLAGNAGLYLRGCQNAPDLSAEEKYQFGRIVAVQMSPTYSAVVQHGEGLIDDEVWEAYCNALRTHMSRPGFRLSWQSFEMHYPRSFRNAAEGA